MLSFLHFGRNADHDHMNKFTTLSIGVWLSAQFDAQWKIDTANMRHMVKHHFRLGIKGLCCAARSMTFITAG